MALVCHYEAVQMRKSGYCCQSRNTAAGSCRETHLAGSSVTACTQAAGARAKSSTAAAAHSRRAHLSGRGGQRAYSSTLTWAG